ncbi:hypothetical protein MRB53_012961 [Persea americana]|uniref:Uncharacterized protein n=1 Tax=Persea americana TaxID=3435 RepID=A0ACC2LZ38_PERAE|nr:hypothetical protein MRB53_012961 [Persea americana]
MHVCCWESSAHGISIWSLMTSIKSRRDVSACVLENKQLEAAEVLLGCNKDPGESEGFGKPRARRQFQAMDSHIAP